ncbi:MAG: TetR/AcrR family transcriptional regulator [Lachnospiraceae bacterium]|nr:TetR/AcrR family transcriptional regulator [Lachnospiraceae bacterium]
MKRKTAKEILVESFQELAKSKSVDKITVQEIVANCGYSTATFYRQFKDKYDLIAWDYTCKLEEIMDQTNYADYSWSDTLIDGAKYFQDNKEYLANLFLHTTGLDSFLQNMTEINDRRMRKYILQSGENVEIDEVTEMYIHMYCHGTVALTCDWVLGKYNVSIEELAVIYENGLPEPLRKYMY